MNMKLPDPVTLVLCIVMSTLWLWYELTTGRKQLILRIVRIVIVAGGSFESYLTTVDYPHWLSHIWGIRFVANEVIWLFLWWVLWRSFLWDPFKKLREE